MSAMQAQVYRVLRRFLVPAKKVLPLRIANRLPTLRRGCSFREAIMSVMPFHEKAGRSQVDSF